MLNHEKATCVFEEIFIILHGGIYPDVVNDWQFLKYLSRLWQCLQGVHIKTQNVKIVENPVIYYFLWLVLFATSTAGIWSWKDTESKGIGKKIKHHSKIRWDSLPVGSCVAHLFCLTIWIPISATLCKLCRCQSSCRQSHRKLSSKLSSDGSIKGWQEKKKHSPKLSEVLKLDNLAMWHQLPEF